MRLQKISTPKPSKRKRKPITAAQKIRKAAVRKANAAKITKAQRSATASKQRDYYQRTKIKQVAAAQGRRARKSVQYKDAKLKRLYGITLEQRDAMLSAQGGLCAICDTDAPGSRDWHVDHCHDTGRVRGILCHHCNVGLGNFRDSKRALSKAIEYLN